MRFITMGEGAPGACEASRDAIQNNWLLSDPHARYCLDRLTSTEQRALEYDLELAARLQRELLPIGNLCYQGWEVAYHYEPLGPVSGDYCDVVMSEKAGHDLFFMLGDAVGKGIAASMLMSHLHATFRSLIACGLPLRDIVERAGSIFHGTTRSSSFATLVCGRANASGQVEICNAGHCPPLLARRSGMTRVESTGFPLGLFPKEGYQVETFQLAPGDTLLLYTDGLTEARNQVDVEFGESRLCARLCDRGQLPEARELIETCLGRLADFLAGAPLTDDLSIMALQRSGGHRGRDADPAQVIRTPDKYLHQKDSEPVDFAGPHSTHRWSEV
jgi:sigma-B regulation protein RsbU (phosphoserine phosphatase)